MLNKKPYHVPGYKMEVLDDEVILFNPSSREIFHSNNTGSLVWQMCDGQRTVNDIIQLLSIAYPDSGRQIERDVSDLLQELAQHGAIFWL